MIKSETQEALDRLLPAAQHGKIRVEEGQRGGRSIYSNRKDVLQRLFDARHITFEQFLAGEQLQELARISGHYAPSGMTITERVGGSGSGNASERQQAARQRYNYACKEITRELGALVQQTVVAVAVFGEGVIETGLLPVNKRMPAVRNGLEVAYNYLFASRDENVNMESQ